jgi:hypothetical protein
MVSGSDQFAGRFSLLGDWQKNGGRKKSGYGNHEWREGQEWEEG